MLPNTKILSKSQASPDTNRITFTAASEIDNKLRKSPALPDKDLIS